MIFRCRHRLCAATRSSTKLIFFFFISREGKTTPGDSEVNDDSLRRRRSLFLNCASVSFHSLSSHLRKLISSENYSQWNRVEFNSVRFFSKFLQAFPYWLRSFYEVKYCKKLFNYSRNFLIDKCLCIKES